MIKELLMSSGYWVLNKSIVKEFGIETAFLLSNLSEAESMMADEEGWFYQTSETLEELTGLSNHKQTLCINQLIEIGALYQQNKGMPRKRYFKIDYETIQRLVFKNFKDLHSKKLNTSIQNFSSNKESINKKSKNKQLNKQLFSEELEKLNISNFLKESLQEWFDYKEEIKNPIKTMLSITKTLNQLGKDYIDEKHLCDSIDFSISRGYKGVFPKEVKKQNTFNTKQQNKIATLEDMKGW